jgi:hypothetical protein
VGVDNINPRYFFILSILLVISSSVEGLKIFAGFGDGSGDADIYSSTGNGTWYLNYSTAIYYRVFAITEYNSKIYAGMGAIAGMGDVLTYLPNGSWGVSYNGLQEEIESFAVYGGNLYAGQGSGGGDGDIYKFNGSAWSLFYDTAYEEAKVMIANGSYLYAGFGSGSGDGDIWRYNGTAWTKIYESGMFEYVFSLEIYNNKLYAGMGSGATDGDILVYDGSTWSTSYNGTSARIQALKVYKNKLYSAVGYGAGLNDIYVLNGTSWSLSYDGSDDTIYSLAVLENNLYAGGGYFPADADVFKFNGTHWTNNYGGSATQDTIRGLYAQSTIASAEINISFVSQSPSDLNITNILGDTLNITYEVTKGAYSLINSTMKLYYKVNSTSSDVQYIVNGTGFSGWRNKSYTNATNYNYMFRLDDNDVYRGNYNYPVDDMDESAHFGTTFTTKNQFIWTEFKNISSTKRYGVYEVMVNGSVKAFPITLYYCNSSYVSGKMWDSPYCSLVGTRTKKSYDHKHKDNSSHAVFSFPVNSTAGIIGDTKVTSTGYFILGGAKDWNYYSINGYVRNGMQKKTSTKGLSWTIDNTIILDSHLHQYDNTDNETLFYYACINDTDSGVCSPRRYDIMELGGLTPSASEVYLPLPQLYGRVIPIAYIPAISPNDYEISYYSIDLLDSNFTFVRTIIANNSKNLNYTWYINQTTNGEYVIRVKATDIFNLSSYGYSQLFNISFNPEIFINITNLRDYEHGNNNLNIDVEVTSKDLDRFIYCQYIIDGVAEGLIVDFNESINDSFSFATNPAQNYTYYVICYSDLLVTMDVIAKQTSLRHFISDEIIPSLNITKPINASLGNNTINLSIYANDTYLLKIFGNITLVGNVVYSFNMNTSTKSAYYNDTINISTWDAGFYVINAYACDTDGFGECLNNKYSWSYFEIDAILNWTYPINNSIINYENGTLPFLEFYKNYIGVCTLSNGNYSESLNATTGNNNITINPTIFNGTYALDCPFISLYKNITFCEYTYTCLNMSNVCDHGFNYCANASVSGNCSAVPPADPSILTMPCDTAELVYDRCPTILSGHIYLIAFLVIGAIIMISSYLFSFPAFSIIGGLIILFCAVSIAGCSSIIGGLMIGIAIIGIAYGVFR